MRLVARVTHEQGGLGAFEMPPALSAFSVDVALAVIAGGRSLAPG